MIFSKIKCKIITFIIKFYIPLYKKKLKKRLKNENFTILCSTCAAGTVYNRLDHRFDTPTINMWFRQKDFIKFCCNLKYYINLELDFVKSDQYNHPVGKLDDIYLYFNHHETEQEAKADWDKRKKRINYDNLYILTYDRAGVPKEEYMKLKEIECNNIVVLTADKNCDLDFAYYIKPTDKTFGESFLDRDWLTLNTFEKNFDFVSWLNVKKKR